MSSLRAPGWGRDRRPAGGVAAGAPGIRADALRVVAVLAVVLAAVLIGSVVDAGAQTAGVVEPGELVVTRQAQGTVDAVAADGTTRTVVSGLVQPRAVVALDDGSLIIAEAGADRVVGIGGRWGPDLSPIAELPFPNGLALTADGSTIYVTSFSAGTVSTVDLGTGAVAELASGLQTPGGVVVRNDTAYVAELNAGQVVAIDAAGRIVPIVEGLSSPIGVAAGQGATLYVAELDTGEVLRVDNGEPTVLANVLAPLLLSSQPSLPSGDEPFQLVASNEAGVVELDPTTGEVLRTVPLPGAVGVAIAGAPETTTTTTVASAGTTGGTAPAADGGAGAGTGTGDEPSGSPAVVIVLAVVILATILGFIAVQLRNATGSDDDDEDEHDHDGATLHEAFGPCVTQELEVERAQAALDAVLLQVSALRRRIEVAATTTEEVRAHLESLRDERERVLTERMAAVDAGDADADVPHPVHLAEQLLTTDGGREALAEYRAGEIGPLELARRWSALGEEDAIARVRQEGDRARQVDPTVPGPDERAAAAELNEIHADVEQATSDLERLAAREAVCREQLEVATEALRDCRDQQAADDGSDPDQAAAWGVAAAARSTADADGEAADADGEGSKGGEGEAADADGEGSKGGEGEAASDGGEAAGDAGDGGGAGDEGLAGGADDEGAGADDDGAGDGGADRGAGSGPGEGGGSAAGDDDLPPWRPPTA